MQVSETNSYGQQHECAAVLDDGPGRNIAARQRTSTLPAPILDLAALDSRAPARKRSGRFQAAIAAAQVDPPAEVKFGYIGRISDEKNLLTLIRVMAEVRKRLPGAKLVLHGGAAHGSKYAEELKRLINEKGLGDCVTLAGPYPQHDLPGILEGLDVMVTVSLDEVGPLTVKEAMMYRRPVVATDVGTAREDLVGGPAGIVVPPTDDEFVRKGPAGVVVPPTDDEVMIRRLVNALTYLGANAEARAAMGWRGRQAALEIFSISKMVEEHVEVFNELCPDKHNGWTIEMGGHPFIGDGVQVFNDRMAAELRRRLRDVKVELRTFMPDSTVRPIPSLIERFHHIVIAGREAHRWGHRAPATAVHTQFIPALRAIFEAADGIAFDESSMAEPEALAPDAAQLHQVMDSLVEMADFFTLHRAYNSVFESDDVAQLYQNAFRDLDEAEANVLRHWSKDFFKSLLSTHPHREPDIIYHPEWNETAMPVLVRAQRSNIPLVLGFHTYNLRIQFRAIDDNPNFSEPMRQAQKRLHVLMAHLLFARADRIIHYTGQSPGWLETHYKVPREKFVESRVGIQDMWTNGKH